MVKTLLLNLPKNINDPSGYDVSLVDAHGYHMTSQKLLRFGEDHPPKVGKLHTPGYIIGRK